MLLPGDNDLCLLAQTAHATALHQHFPWFWRITRRPPALSSIRKRRTRAIAMPDMAMITRQDDDTPRFSGCLQQPAQGANGFDGPGIANLLGSAQAVVNRIDHDPYYFVLL